MGVAEFGVTTVGVDGPCKDEGLATRDFFGLGVSKITIIIR